MKRVIVAIENGVIQSIWSDEDVVIRIVDWDDLKAGHLCDPSNNIHAYSESDGTIEQWIEKYQEELEDYNKRNEMGEP